MRGYHSQKDRLPGYELGQLNSYYYIEKQHKEQVRHYFSVRPPMWSRYVERILKFVALHFCRSMTFSSLESSR